MLTTKRIGVTAFRKFAVTTIGEDAVPAIVSACSNARKGLTTLYGAYDNGKLCGAVAVRCGHADLLCIASNHEYCKVAELLLERALTLNERKTKL